MLSCITLSSRLFIRAIVSFFAVRTIVDIFQVHVYKNEFQESSIFQNKERCVTSLSGAQLESFRGT